MSDGIKLAGRYDTLDEAVAGGFFKHYLAVFAEEFDEVGRAFLAALIFGLVFCKLTRAFFGKLEFAVGGDLG